MPEMTGAEAMFEMMVRQGVRYVFGNPGTTELPLMDLFAARNEIEYILALHEDAALGMAVGYAEAARTPAVVNLHTNPGLAHALGNLYNASRMGTPLIVTAGQQDTRGMIEEPLLCADMLDLARQHTKWQWEVHHAAEVPAAMARAFKIAATPPTGPVFVSFPVNVMEERADVDFPEVTAIASRVRGDSIRIEAAAALLASAEMPVIIAGDGCARSEAVPELLRLAEMLGARAHSEPLNSLLDFPTAHSLYAGPLVPNARETLARLDGADVILIIGVNNLAPLVYTGTRMLPPGVRIVQVDLDDRELGKNYHAEVAIHGDPKTVLAELNEAIDSRLDQAARKRIAHRRDSTVQRIARSRAKFAELADAAPAEGPIPPALAAREMRLAADGSAVLVDEAVTSTGYVRALFGLNEPHSYFYAKGGSLGLGLPMALGVKLAMPDRPVICTVGDGCSLYSIQGLWTAARYRLGIVFVIFNNSSYVILKGGLLAMRGESVKRGVYVGMDLTDPEVDFVKLAESMGVAARRAVRPSELKPAFDWALSQTGPSLVDVAISRDIQSILR